MSDEEDETFSSPEEGFSASEDEWKPTKDMQKGGESSDDDDSDFEDLPILGGAGSSAVKRREPKGRSATKQQAVKKRKATGQSLRSKLYNKYKPPPKTFPTRGDSNSPSASTSKVQKKASKNSKTPNDDSDEDDNSSSDSSVDDYLVNPAELDLRSSFFDVGQKKSAAADVDAVPQFDCNAGMKLTDSEDNESSSDEKIQTTAGKAFDFRNLLEKATSLERVKETIAKRAASGAEEKRKLKHESSTAAMDVESLLALGENQAANTDANCVADDAKEGRQKLRQTKSTRQKRHTKTRPASMAMAAAGESEDSDWEEVADDISDDDAAGAGASKHNKSENLEIHVEFPNKQRQKKSRDQQDLENALKRKLNRDIKERQLLLHKASLLCFFARSYSYNRLLNDTMLMKEAIKLLPSKNAYPPERGTELKYFQSLVTWFKTTIKLKSENLYADKTPNSKDKIKKLLLEEFNKKEARCKQDMVLMFVILVRGMGLQCRLVVNMQPLPLRPAQSDLCTVKLKKDDKEGEKKDSKKESIDKNQKPKRESVESKEKVEKSTQRKTNSNKIKEKDNAKKSAESKDKLNNSKDNNEIGEKASDKESPKSVPSKRKMRSSNDLREITANEATKAASADKLKKSAEKPKVIISKEDTKIKIKNDEKQSPSKDINNKEVAADKLKHTNKPTLTKLKRNKPAEPSIEIKKSKWTSNDASPQSITQKTVIPERTTRARKSIIEIVINSDAAEQQPSTMTTTSENTTAQTKESQKKKGKNATPRESKEKDLPPPTKTRSGSKSPTVYVSPNFLKENKVFKEKFSSNVEEEKSPQKQRARSKSPKDQSEKVKISTAFLKGTLTTQTTTRTLRSRQKPSNQDAAGISANTLQIPQLDGADNIDDVPLKERHRRKVKSKKVHKSQSAGDTSDDDDFEPSPPKRPKPAAVLPKVVAKLRKDRRVLSTDEETSNVKARNSTAADMWVEVWSDVEEQWICVDLFKGKLHSVEAIRKAATSSFAYVYAFQNDLSIKDITARYCPHWTTTVRKSRVEKAWLDVAISSYLGRRTKRDIREDQELRRIHEEKPMPTSISDYKDHPLYALERHLLKFQAIYPPEPPTLGFIRGEPVYARECVHTLHSREIWLKSARTVKLGEQPYKIVKARPKWDRITQTVIKDQPLEIFGFWQTQEYEPPTAENGIVPRNAYGNVELFKECMLPKKTVHMRLNGLNRICKKLGIDCANAVIGFDFHQGACHPLYDGFVICEEFEETVKAAWEEDQENQAKKEQEKYEARVYGNWKKLIRGLLIRERLKKKYNF